MAKLTRVTQKIFASGAGASQIIKFGSYAAGLTVYSSDPTVIQSLGNWLTGWFGAVVGGNSPNIEDMNAVHYVYAYQLAYIMQSGIPEWDAGTTYYIDSFCSSGGKIYVSLTNNNLNNAVTDTNNWRGNLVVNLTKFTGNGSYVVPAGVTSVRVTATRAGGRKEVFPNNSGQSAVIDNFSNLYMFGRNDYGQLGVGNTTVRSSPVIVLGGLSWAQVSTPPTNTTPYCVGITTSGALYGWGDNRSGQLGLGDVTPRSSPIAILAGKTFRSVHTDLQVNTLALAANGVLYAIGGTNVNGQLGVGDVTPRSVPLLVLGGLKFSSISACQDAFVGLTPGGVAYAWGYNAYGQLGVGDIVDRSSPVLVLGGLTFAKIVTDGDSVFGLTPAGVLYAWGFNAAGQLGVGNIVNRSSPVAVLGGITFADIFGIGGGAIGITSDGTAYAWGYNGNGELGVGDVNDRSSPVLVLGGLKFSRIAGPGSTAAEFYTLGLTTSGDLYAWGYNGNGQLGVGGTTDRSSPVIVLGGFKWAKFDVATGNFGSSYGVTQQGVFYSWGYNENGQLGLGDVTSRSSPVAVLGTVLPKIGQDYASVTIPVTAGATYPVVLQQYIPFFGNTPIANWPVSQVTVEYDQ